jgi:hypothetical protein
MRIWTVIIVVFLVGDIIRSHHEVLDDFVVVVFDPLKTGSPLFFWSKLAAPRSFHQVSNTVVKLVRQVLLEGRFCWLASSMPPPRLL